MTIEEMKKCINVAKAALVENPGVDKFTFAWIDGYITALSETNEGLSNRRDELSEAIVESIGEAGKLIQ